MKDGYGVDPL